MRVSTSQIYNIANVGMRDAQSAVTRTQEQISSGKKLQSPADDPIAAVTILQLQQELARTEQYNKNINIAENNLGLEDSTLKTVVNLVQRMQELAVSAGNTSTMTAKDYQSIASEVDSRIQELLSLQNTRNSSGQYIFAGYQSDQQPFIDNGMGRYSYVGDDGQLVLQATGSISVPVNDSGKKLFVDIPSSHNTFATSSNPNNRAQPESLIGVGRVVDQDEYDKLFPENLVITFNDHGAVTPAGLNYTVTEKNSGKVLLANEPFKAGDEIRVAGLVVPIYGNPASPIPGVIEFTNNAPAAANTSFSLKVNGQTQTFAVAAGQTVQQALTANAQNADKLQKLGLTVSATGITSSIGHNITLGNGSAQLDAMVGLSSQGVGTTSTNGRVGDNFSIESSQKEPIIITLTRFSEALRAVKDTPESKAEFAKVVASTLANLDNSVTSLSIAQGEVGARLNTLESAKDLNAETILMGKKSLSELEDLDYAEASIRLAIEEQVLSAAQQSFIKVSKLTLFQYM